MVIGVPWILSKEGATSLGIPGAAKSSGSLGLMLGFLAATAVVVALWAPWTGAAGSADGVHAAERADLEVPLAEAMHLDSPWNPEVTPATSDRTAVKATPSEATPTEWTFPVRVTLDGLPVEGAAVWAYQPLLRTNEGYFSSASHADLVRLRMVPAQLLEMGRRRSQVVTTNANGEARVFSSKANVFVFAQHTSGLWVQTVLNVPERAKDTIPVELALDGDRGVHAKVVGPLGRPAQELPVELLMAKEPGPGS